MPLLLQLAELASAGGADGFSGIEKAGFVLSMVLNGILVVKMLSAKPEQRQIEPTQMADIRAELKEQTSTLGKLDREMGEIREASDLLAKEFDSFRRSSETRETGIHQRISGISRELAGTAALVGQWARRRPHEG